MTSKTSGDANFAKLIVCAVDSFKGCGRCHVLVLYKGEAEFSELVLSCIHAQFRGVFINKETINLILFC